ncbi:hypothetical protein P3T25_000260 [Paraburkholderia sp. GAS32]
MFDFTVFGFFTVAIAAPFFAAKDPITSARQNLTESGFSMSINARTLALSKRREL